MRWRVVAGALAGILLLGAGLVVDRRLAEDRSRERAQPLIVVSEVPEPTPTRAPTPTPTPTPSPSPPPGPDYTALTAQLAQIVAAHPGPGTRGIAVIDGEGRPVLLDRADVAMIPASTQKLVTAAAALAALGPDFRYRTEVAATAPLGPDGTITGDLVLIGSGDPALSTPLFTTRVAAERPRTPLEGLVEQVVATGVRRVTGRVLGDPTALADEPVAAGWTDEYFAELDAARVAGLTVDAGRHLFVEGVELRGEPAVDPAAEAAAVFTTMLAERGVIVDGGSASTRTPPPAATALGAVESPPLSDLLQWTLQRSDNPMADQIFRTLGRLVGGDGSWLASTIATRRILDGLRLDWTGVVLADGSGLSRENRLPAAFLVGLDIGIRHTDLQASWDGLMAVAGESGTLSARLIGTPAEHRLHGKTGSLEDVRALAGSVTGPDGQRLHLAVIGNDLDPAGVETIRALQDALAIAVAESMYACVPAPCPV